MQVRKATVNDLSDLAELFNDYRIFYEKETDIKGARKFLEERIMQHESEIFIAFANNEISGFMQLYPLFSSTRMKRLWLLNDLFVKEKYRGQGISMLLIEQAKELCRQTNACGFSLETAKTNYVGNQLYQKMKLQLDTEHNNYYWEL